ncbi:Cytochrome P450 family ent-kaurenoic acid oxidase [Quillaja saponaria]|uniref:Cytochrome P450 family ent-kaurenoic acid oxidase n=1 Tax=Quillaja saponaria TaxID=32244 RepID=A0AAD7PPE1_QUISA|nr:Cytochrome P450 family ent-kaurenoic acid oxidase [Quillaja saponaria]
MELEWLWLSLAAFLGGYVFVFGFLRNVNEWYYVCKQGKKQYPLPPGDMGWPLLGNLITFMRTFRSGDPDSFINNLISRYGRTGIYKTHLFGNPSIIICMPEICRQVLVDDQTFKYGYPKTTLLLTGKRSFHSLSNAEHKRLRRLTIAPITGHHALAMYIDRIEDIVINSLEEWASMYHPIELFKETKKISFKVITHIFMGSKSDSVIKAVDNLFGDLHNGLISIPINIPGFTFHKALKARKKLVSILQSFVEKRRVMMRSEKYEEKKDMMDKLLVVEDEDGRKLEDEEIIDLLLLFLLAGHDSSALGMLWSTIYLTENPEFLQKAKEEQEEIIRRRSSTRDRLNLTEIRQMVLLSKVIEETLRRTNILFSIFREANIDVNINGYTIPKGWKVLIWSRGVHMDPEIYANPLEFNPTRWNNNNAKVGSYLPFGAGSRLCPGSDLAKLEITIFLHYFLLNYKLERTNPKCPWTYLPVPTPRDNCLAKVIKIP